MSKKIYYIHPEALVWTTKVKRVKKEEEYILLSSEESIFYPEGGGQPSDEGEILGNNFKLMVFNVFSDDDEIWHKGYLEGIMPVEGEEVVLKINEDLRKDYMEQHTAQHLLSAILERDYALSTTGFQIFKDHSKIEVPTKLDFNDSLIKEIEEKVNTYIRKDISVKIYWQDSKIRIVEIPDLDINPCGGLHVNKLSDLGLLKILDVYKKNNDFWRIEFIAGRRILKRLDIREKEYNLLKAKLGSPYLVEDVTKLIDKLEGLYKENKNLKEKLNVYIAKELLNSAIKTPLGLVVIKVLDEDINNLKFISQHVIKEEEVLCILFNAKGQGIISRAKTFNDETWDKVVCELAKYDWKGSKGDYFLQGNLEKFRDFLNNLAGIFTID